MIDTLRDIARDLTYELHDYCDPDVLYDAADEIQRLRAEVTKYKSAMRVIRYRGGAPKKLLDRDSKNG